MTPSPECQNSLVFQCPCYLWFAALHFKLTLLTCVVFFQADFWANKRWLAVSQYMSRVVCWDLLVKFKHLQQPKFRHWSFGRNRGRGFTGKFTFSINLQVKVLLWPDSFRGKGCSIVIRSLLSSWASGNSSLPILFSFPLSIICQRGETNKINVLE